MNALLILLLLTQTFSRPHSVTTGITLNAVIESPANTMQVAPYSDMFSAVESSTTFGEINKYIWDFDDTQSSDPQFGRGKLIHHRFDNPGTYNVSLTVFNSIGQMDRTVFPVTIVPFTGPTFYVSSSTGNDTNDGLTPATAWQTFEYAIQHVGGNRGFPEKLLLKRGDTWTVNSHVFARDATFIGAYGVGHPKPLLDFPSTFDYRLNTGFNNNIDHEFGRSVIVDDIHFINSLGSHSSEFLLAFSRTGCAARNCDFENGSVGLIGIWDGGTETRADKTQQFTVENCTVTNGKRQGIWIAATHWVSVTGCILTGSGSNAILDHQIYASGASYGIVYDTVFDGAVGGLNNFGFKLNVLQDFLVFKCEFKNTRNALGIGRNAVINMASFGITCDSLIIHDCGKFDQSSAFFVDHVLDLVIRNCVIWNVNTAPTYGRAVFVIRNQDPGTELRIYNNTLFSNELSDLQVETASNPPIIKYMNNISYKDDTYNINGSAFIDLLSYPGPVDPAAFDLLESNYNNFYWTGQTESTKIFRIYTSSLTANFTEWQALGNDTHSLYGDPLFRDQANLDFYLQVSSPGFESGSNLPIVKWDINNYERPEGIANEMGAYEWVGP